MTMLNAVQTYAANAAVVLAVGSCASFGGLSAGSPNPTGASSVLSRLERERESGQPPGLSRPSGLDRGNGRVHIAERRVRRSTATTVPQATARSNSSLGLHQASVFRKRPVRHNPHDPGCLFKLGCKGPMTPADCPQRQWNGSAAATRASTRGPAREAPASAARARATRTVWRRSSRSTMWYRLPLRPIRPQRRRIPRPPPRSKSPPPRPLHRAQPLRPVATGPQPPHAVVTGRRPPPDAATQPLPPCEDTADTVGTVAKAMIDDYSDSSGQPYFLEDIRRF